MPSAQHLGVPPARLDHRQALATLGGGILARLPHCHVGQEREEEDDDRADDHRPADQRVDEEADEDLERQERQVGERRRAAAGDEAPDLVEVAQRLEAVAGQRIAQRQRHDGAEDLGMHHLVEIGGYADQDARPHVVEEPERQVEDRRDEAEADERRYALAGHDAVVDLEHEQRTGEGQDVHDAAEHDDPAERAPAIVKGCREFRSSGIVRPLTPPQHWKTFLRSTRSPPSASVGFYATVSDAIGTRSGGVL